MRSQQDKAAARRIRAGVVCTAQGNVLCVALVDPVTGEKYWMPPGGRIEPGEIAPDAAERETLEETGYRVFVDRSDPFTVDYVFTWAGSPVRCTTTFYRAMVGDFVAEPTRLESYHAGHLWLPQAQLLERLRSHVEIRQAVAHFIV